MTFAAERWPAPRAAADRRRRTGALAVWGREVVKLTRLVRVQAVVLACAGAPFIAAAGLTVQDAVPADTLFGQWVHASGFALSMVVLGFAGQWALPFVVAVVAGDIFSSEDRYGTWKTVLTRSRSRADLFTGKALATATYVVGALTVLAGASLAAGLTLGAHPVIGLGGQLVPAQHAARLVVESWALQLPPMLGFAALAVLLSVASRNSVIGIGGPVLVGLLFQVLALVNLPGGVRVALLSTPFESWHGLWVPHPYHGPVWHGLITSAGWFVVCGGLSAAVFARRDLRVGT